MTSELRELAVLITTLPGWEWRVGMRVSFPGDSGVVYAAPWGDSIMVCFDSEKPPIPLEEWQLAGCVPDLTDDATAGAMLGLLPADISASVTKLPHCCSASCTQLILRAMITGRGATLGEAIARMVVTRGGWLAAR